MRLAAQIEDMRRHVLRGVLNWVFLKVALDFLGKPNTPKQIDYLTSQYRLELDRLLRHHVFSFLDLVDVYDRSPSPAIPVRITVEDGQLILAVEPLVDWFLHTKRA